MSSRFYSCSICKRVIDSGCHISVADHNKSCNQDARNKELSDKINDNHNAIQMLMEGMSRRKKPKTSCHEEQPDEEVLPSLLFGRKKADVKLQVLTQLKVLPLCIQISVMKT